MFSPLLGKLTKKIAMTCSVNVAKNIRLQVCLAYDQFYSIQSTETQLKDLSSPDALLLHVCMLTAQPPFYAYRYSSAFFYYPGVLLSGLPLPGLHYWVWRYCLSEKRGFFICEWKAIITFRLKGKTFCWHFSFLFFEFFFMKPKWSICCSLPVILSLCFLSCLLKESLGHCIRPLPNWPWNVTPAVTGLDGDMLTVCSVTLRENIQDI